MILIKEDKEIIILYTCLFDRPIDNNIFILIPFFYYLILGSCNKKLNSVVFFRSSY